MIAVEVAGGHVDSVVEVLNDRLDLGTGLIGHTPGAIDHVRRSPVVAQWLTNPTRNHEVAGSVPALAQWVNDPALP